MAAKRTDKQKKNYKSTVHYSKPLLDLNKLNERWNTAHSAFCYICLVNAYER